MNERGVRYIVRELYGQTIGESTSSWQFLVLDTDDCHRVVLEKHSGRDAANSHLRRCIHEYAAALNNPPLCACGCGIELPVRYPLRPRGGSLRLYLDKTHTDKACEDRRRARRRASYTRERP